MKQKFFALIFLSLFLIGILQFSVLPAQATTAHSTGASSPSIDPFSDYDFNETYPSPDISNPKIPEYYDVSSGGSPEVYFALYTFGNGMGSLACSDDDREGWSANTVTWANSSQNEIFDLSYYIYFPTASDYTLTFEGYKTTYGTALTISMSVCGNTVLSAVSTSETTYTYTLSYRTGDYVVVRFHGVGVYDTSCDTLVIDRLCIQPHYDSGASDNFADDMRTNYLWNPTPFPVFSPIYLAHYPLWNVHVTSDGDYLYMNPLGFRFDYEDWGGDEHEDGDDNIVGWTQVDTLNDIKITTNQCVSSPCSVELDAIHTTMATFRKSDFSLTTASDITLEFYIMFDCLSSASGNNLHIGAYGNGLAKFYMYFVQTSSTQTQLKYYIYANSSYVALGTFTESQWYHIRMNFKDDTQTVDICIDGTTWYYDLPYRVSTAIGITTLYFQGKLTSGSGVKYWLDNILIYKTDTMEGMPTTSYNCDYARIETSYLSQTISASVPFLEIYVETSGGSSNTVNLHLSNATSFLSDGVNYINVFEMVGSTTINLFRLWYLGADSYVKIDYIRFYGFQNYVYSDMNGNKDSIAYNDGTRLTLSMTFASTDDEYHHLERDITDFSTDAYKYAVIDGYKSSAVDFYIELIFTDATTQILNITSTSRTETLFNLTPGKTTDKIRIYLNDNPDSTASGTYHGYLYSISFSVMDIDVDSVTVNYENTWLSPNQSISITNITAKWRDGTDIPSTNFKFNIFENTSILVSGDSVSDLPFSREVQLYNTTYTVSIESCTDTRFRYWVHGSNYTFWVVGTYISVDFEYDWQVVSSGGYLGTFYQIEQLQFANGSAVTSGATMHMWVNTTYKGYEVFSTSGWLPNRMTHISLPSTSTWMFVWFNISIGDFWQAIPFTPIYLPSVAQAMDWVRLGFHTPSGQVIPFETFRVKIHHDTTGSDEWIYTNMFVMDKYGTVDIFVYDIYNQLIFSQLNVAWNYYLDYQITVYSYKIYNQQGQFVHIQLSRYGTSQQYTEWLAPGEIAEFFLSPATYQLTLTYENLTTSIFTPTPILSDYYFRITGLTSEDILQGQIEIQHSLDILQILTIIIPIIAGLLGAIVSVYTIYTKVLPYLRKKIANTISIGELLKRRKPPEKRVEDKIRQIEKERGER